MGILIKDRAALGRIRKLLTTLDNKTVSFPITLYRGEGQTVAFMKGNCDREFSVKTEKGKQRFQMSDRPGAQSKWIAKEIRALKKLILLND